MTEAGGLARADADALAAEFARFARYVADAETTPYQAQKYVAFHRQRALIARDGLDRIMLGLARAGGLGLALADAYSGTLYRTGVVRAKLMLVLAILESAPPSFPALDRPDPGGLWSIVPMGVRMMGAACTLLAAAVLLAPAHVWFAATGRLRRAAP